MLTVMISASHWSLTGCSSKPILASRNCSRNCDMLLGRAAEGSNLGCSDSWAHCAGDSAQPGLSAAANKLLESNIRKIKDLIVDIGCHDLPRTITPRAWPCELRIAHGSSGLFLPIKRVYYRFSTAARASTSFLTGIIFSPAMSCFGLLPSGTMANLKPCFAASFKRS